MITLDVEQGSPEWMDARLGIPTASQFDRLLTPKTRKPSKGAIKYRNEIMAEWLLGHPLEWGTSGWMERGTEMEEEARRWYAFTRDVEVETVGFVLRDDRNVGGSPDGLVGDDGGVEIKCLSAANHVGVLLDGIEDYVGQVQGYMYLTDRKWWDVLCYHPTLPSRVERVERDDEYVKALVPILDAFVEDLDERKEQWAEHRVQPSEPASLDEIVEDYARWTAA